MGVHGGGGPGKRWGHTCNSVFGGKLLYVFGGYGKDNRHSNKVHVFDTGAFFFFRFFQVKIAPFLVSGFSFPEIVVSVHIFLWLFSVCLFRVFLIVLNFF